MVAAALSTLVGCESVVEAEGTCGLVRDLFPTPVSFQTTLFVNPDDGVLQVFFDNEFAFPFYGELYGSVFLNTNGGMTFGEGESNWNTEAVNVLVPGIGVFWGDMYAGLNATSSARADQMTFEVCDDRFIVRYQEYQDINADALRNTATVTLFGDGSIVIEYGEVLSPEILVGIWDGTHTNDTYPALVSDYPEYASAGTGILLFDFFQTNTPHAGELTGQTITFSP